MDIIIIGCTSNICKIRVFDNLYNLYEKINKIYCVSSRNYSQTDWKNYIHTININNNIINKMEYIECKYNLEDYNLKLSNIVKENTYIYVSTPPICYKELILFRNNIRKGNLILEKPLAINYEEFKNIEHLLNEKINMIDHFVYKKDIQKIINMNIQQIKEIKFIFFYNDDVEDRLGYFDKTGFFIDMFQSHLLSILYLIIGDDIEKIFKSNIDIERKQYENYGGKNKEIDTYFHIKMIHNDIKISMNIGKAMSYIKKQIIINDEIFDIGDYKNEYYLFFNNIKNDINIINKQDKFWKITEFIKSHFKDISFYKKNNFEGIIE